MHVTDGISPDGSRDPEVTNPCTAAFTFGGALAAVLCEKNAGGKPDPARRAIPRGSFGETTR